MKLFTITATPVQSKEQMERNGYDITPDNTVEHINKLHLGEYPKIVAELLSSLGIDGFTIYPVQGYWKGEAEQSFKIEIAIDSDPERVYTVAGQLRDTYNQDAVMVTLPNNSVRFV